MDPVDELVKELTFREVKELLVDLAIHFSDKTEIISVPVGTKTWIAEKFDEDRRLYPPKSIHIQLVHFFGMYVGYNSELDLLVMWKI